MANNLAGLNLDDCPNTETFYLWKNSISSVPESEKKKFCVSGFQ